MTIYLTIMSNRLEKSWNRLGHFNLQRLRSYVLHLFDILISLLQILIYLVERNCYKYCNRVFFHFCRIFVIIDRVRDRVISHFLKNLGKVRKFLLYLILSDDFSDLRNEIVLKFLSPTF